MVRLAPTSTTRAVVVLTAILFLSGCEVFTDAATRLAYDLESASKKLKYPGDRFTLYHEPAGRGGCGGPYTVQLDKVGALVIWCKDESGEVVASPGTSYHRRFVKTPKTYYLNKGAGEALVIELEQIQDSAVIIDAH